MSKRFSTIDLLIVIKNNVLFFFKTLYEFLFTNSMQLRNKCESDRRLEGKVVVITGANTGIGKETALQLSLRGAKIIIGCRDLEKAENAVKEMKEKNSNAMINVLKLDLNSFQSIRHFCQSVTEMVSQIDILINNAGVMMCPEWVTEDGFEMQFGTNYLGHFLLTHLLLSSLKKSLKARIINLSSICHILGKIHFNNINLKNGVYSPLKAYSQSKLALILFTREMAKRLGAESNVNVYCLHPGVVQTDITQHFQRYLYYLIKYFMTTIEMGSQTTLFCALDSSLDSESGFYYDNCKRIDNMVFQARDDKSAQNLYDISCEFVKLEEELRL